MITIIKRLCICLSAVLLVTACSDELFDIGPGRSDGDGIQFVVTTTEMGHEVVTMGSTRGGGEAIPGTPDEGDRFTECSLEGDNPFGLKIHKQPVPVMGFNRGAVKASSPSVGPSVGGPVRESAILSQTQQQPQSMTRAGANEVVLDDGTNFHDSLTIWGYTSANTELFDQILLTKVRNWRNSVEWPYNQGEYMRFYSVAPSLESINMSATGGSYSAAPTLTYTLPEKANELMDVLYGESENISIAAGPAGSVTTNPQQENLGKDNKFVDLQFRHITTAVRFSQGTIPDVVTINSISISGLKTAGTYNPSQIDEITNTQGKWTIDVSSAPGTYTVTTNHVGTGNEGATDVPITGASTLFLLPQTLPAGAQLRIELTERLKDEGGNLTNKTKEHTLTCSLTGDVWKKGYTVDYKITIGRLESGYYLSTSVANIEIEHSSSAVSSTLGVNSYRLYYDYSSGEKVASYTPVTWDIAGYSETGADDSYVAPTNKPASLSWLTDFRGVLNPDNHYNGGNNATATFTVAGQTMALSTTHTTVLSGNSTPPASSLDLSMYPPYAGAAQYLNQEPANCYIVNRIGSYTFPLVYGNKTSNGPEAACFKDHQGNTIQYSNIMEQQGIYGSSVPVEATTLGDKYLWEPTGYSEDGKPAIESTLRVHLLWQDVKGLITEPTVSATNNNIGFTVSSSSPGNAVLALQARKVSWEGTWDNRTNITYGEWETLWCWHIWMTDEVFQNSGVENTVSYDAYYVNGSKTKEKADHIAQLKDASGNNNYKILPVDLGWVPDNDNFGLYEPRSVWVKLKQTGTENTAVVKIIQNARQELYTGTGTVYQWGRPTAFPSVNKIPGDIRTIYDIGNNNITSKFVLAQSTNGGDAISNTFGVLQWESNANCWFDVNNADYATANAMWYSTTKTKTVYDPCPPGFRVPPAQVFYGFSKKDGDSGSAKTIEVGTGNEAGKLNMWPDTRDLNGVTQRNGVRSKGAYFYCKPNETDRYGDMVYMPATGEWHGNKSVGTKLQDNGEQLNQPTGIFWTSDYHNNKDSKACALWITPEYTFSAGTPDKPVLGFFDSESHKLNYYTNLRGIRPMKIE